MSLVYPKVVIDGDVTIGAGVVVSGTVAVSSIQTPVPVVQDMCTVSRIDIPQSNVSQLVFSGNVKRRGFILTNNAASLCYVQLSTPASPATTALYSIRLTSNGQWDCWMPYVGSATVVWGSGGLGDLHVTEFLSF